MITKAMVTEGLKRGVIRLVPEGTPFRKGTVCEIGNAARLWLADVIPDPAPPAEMVADRITAMLKIIRDDPTKGGPEFYDACENALLTAVIPDAEGSQAEKKEARKTVYVLIRTTQRVTSVLGQFTVFREAYDAMEKDWAYNSAQLKDNAISGSEGSILLDHAEVACVNGWYTDWNILEVYV